MNDYNASDPDVSRAIRSWLHEDRHEDVSRIAGAVLDRVEAIPQRRPSWWPARRTSVMNKIVGPGLAAAAVVAAVIIGSQFFGSPSGGPGAGPTATATSEPSVAAPSTAPGGTLPEGPHTLWSKPLGVTIDVTISAPGWYGEPGEGILVKDDNINAPDGAGLIVFARTNDLLVGTGDLDVYGDPCHWASTKPDAPVTTVDEAVAALSSQASRDASTPMDVTLDGFAGKAITLHVPDDAVFSECDQGEFRTLAEGEESARYAQSPGQVDLLWVLDVNGELVIIDIAHYEGTPESVLDELGAIVESANLEYAP